MKIIVIGSSNTDLVVQSPRLPKAGETILGSNFFQNQGGKGANQAVAAAKLGGDVTFVANVGQDDFGAAAISSYQKVGIDDRFIRQVEKATGMAMINVDANGENCIVVVPGANDTLSIQDIDKLEDEIDERTIVLLQLEIPISTVEYAVQLAKRKGAYVVVNPAPAHILQKEVLRNIDLITPNETELDLLVGQNSETEEDLLENVKKLHEMGVANVIVTLGAKGCYYSGKETTSFFRAPKVEVVDTTAAGDVFNGAFTAAFAQNKSMEESIHFALEAASTSVTQMGAQESIPTLTDLKV